MLQHKPLSEIGGSDLGWLKAKRHFAISRHSNPAHRAVNSLFVLNDDEIAAGTGFPLHGHADIWTPAAPAGPKAR